MTTFAQKLSEKFRTVCPECGYPQFCGCQACAPGVPDGITPYRATPDGEGYVCGNCGFVASCDYWLDIEVEQLRTWSIVHGVVPPL